MKSTCHNSSIVHYKNGHYCTVCFTEQFKTTHRTGLLSIGLTIVLILIASLVKAPSLNWNTATYGVYQHRMDDIVPNDSSVLEELIKNKCVLASVAVAQARLESANYTSGIAVNNKNLFGIKAHICPYVTGERNGHATFASYKDNIACYCKIQHRYLAKIDKSYAADTLYCKLIRQMK
jgi:hypothetical protein